MSDKDFQILINGVGNDLKIAIDDLINIIMNIQEDVEKLKQKGSKTD
jgi:hypothetical protein